MSDRARTRGLRRLPAMLVLLVLAACSHAVPGASAACEVPVAGTGDGSRLIRSHMDLEQWLARCPSTLDALRPGTRERFLSGLRFNERGVVDYPVGELTAELTTDEITGISRLLGLDMIVPGLRPEEAARLRASELPPAPTFIEQRFDRFHRAYRRLEDDLEGAARSSAMVELYHSQFPAAIGDRTAGPHDPGLLYRAAISTAMYSRDPGVLEAARDAYARLSGLGLATRAHAMDMMHLLLDAGLVQDARQLALGATGHGLPRLPPVRDEAAHAPATSIWDLAASDALVRRPVEPAPVRIVVRASLGCRYSMAAAEAIAADPELGPVFREHAIWLAPPRELAGYERLRKWNREHPDTPIHIAADTAGWPAIDWDHTPGFHVFVDGELVERVTSWPIREGNRDAVIAALRKAGL